MGFPPIVREVLRTRLKGKSRAREGETIFWREKDYLHGRTVDAGVILLKTRGCYWAHSGGCTMCGYVYHSGEVAQEEILKSFSEATKELGEVEYLKIFNSGSFFDSNELSPETREKILVIASETNAKRVQVESRPEFITHEVVRQAVESFSGEVEIGIGLESADDRVREICINKGFSFEQFRRAVRICRESGARVKAYILIKPPFLSEAQAIEDAVNSAVLAYSAGATRISLNPLNVQRHTLVDELFIRGEYSPPWLWSVVEVIKRIKLRLPDVTVVCKPSGAGRARGASNCRKCSSKVARAIEEFSVTQDVGKLSSLDCECREEWRLKLIYEEAVN